MLKSKTYKEVTVTCDRMIEWIGLNDDTEFVKDSDPILSVTATMVTHLFDVNKKQVIKDIKKVIKANE